MRPYIGHISIGMVTVMGFDQAVVRRADGRFLPGCSGSLAGEAAA